MNGTSSGILPQGSKFVYPTLDLKKNLSSSVQFHQDKTSSTSNGLSIAGKISQRILHPFELKEQVNYKVHIPNFTNLPPLQLGSQYITELNNVDSVVPSDLYYSEINKPDGLDDYFFDCEKGLNEFSRFEKVNQLNLPDKFFDEYNSTETSTKIGLFPEIERAWIIADNKLVMWNYKIPQSSFNTSSQFLTIDQVRNSILTVKVVKPRADVFVKEVNWLLLVATTQDIHIFIIKYDSKLNNLEIFNPDLSVNTQGLIVNNFTVNEKTNEIYFTGEGDGTNIWKLNYSNKSSFTKNKCDKVCLTKTGLSSVIPSRLPGIDLFNYDNSKNSTNNQNLPECIVQTAIDADRDILYTLSNKSVIRVYKLQAKQEQLTEASKLIPSQITKQMSSIFIDSINIKVLEKFTIIKLEVIPPRESSSIQLIAVTSYGCRILLKLGSNFGYSFNSFANSSRLTVASIKFPPSIETPIINPELDSFAKSKQHISQTIANQQKSQLLKNTKIAKIISPGIFLCAKRTKRSDKLFVATPNYGALKKKNKYSEDAEFIKFGTNDSSNNFTYIQDIIQLTPSMNAANTPNGYSNILASQYTKKPLQFAVLTNFGIIIYQYKLSDQTLKSLKEDTIEYFMDENGEEETCSTLLYLACSQGPFNSGDLYKRKAQMIFATLGNNARLADKSQSVSVHSTALIGNQLLLSAQDSHPTVDQVILSDRFYGTCLLVARLFREFWEKKVFTALPHIKFTTSNGVDISSVKNDNLIIKGLGIDKKQVEFFTGSVIVLIDFFAENGSNIPGLNAPNYSSDPSHFENEVCMRAEHIAFTSILKSLESMKEALLFLMVLIEETQTNTNDTFKFLSIVNQVNLLTLSFKDLLLPGSAVKSLIKDLLSSIINKSILKGGSIDSIASSLQGRCASFCSTDDILIFKALESLTRAKNIGARDNELKVKCLKTAVSLFEKAYESLTLENINNAMNIMIELQFYSGAVDLLLKLATKVGNRKIHNNQYEALITKDNSSRIQEAETKKTQLYQLIFNILTKVDLEALRVSGSNSQLKINEFTEIRDSTYETCFASGDKEFHYQFYQWFIDQGVKERLLEIQTPFILPFLEEKSSKDLVMSDLLWLNYAKKSKYFEAANILYGLALSQFKLNLNQRIEYLSRANGFCNCVCPPNLRQKMIQLSAVVQELFDVANVQLDLLSAIEKDKRISKENKETATAALYYKIVSISELFNNYADPLGYYDICLLIFMTSDYKNTDDILKRWELFFEKIYYEILLNKNDSKQEPFHILLNKSFCPLGIKLSTNDLVFPIDELIKLIGKYLNESSKEFPTANRPSDGYIVDLFINSGVSYDKLYFVMKSLIEHNTFEIYPGFTKHIANNEMVYLIKKWYSHDKKLRDFVEIEAITNLTEYSLDKDPIKLFVKHSGILF
jgi:nuclear pore complex protein Nup155